MDISREFLHSQLDYCETLLEPHIQECIQSSEFSLNHVARSYAEQQILTENWYEKLKTSKDATGFMFITVNPMPGVSLQTLKSSTELFVSKEHYIHAAAYSYEVTRNANRSPHVHILFKYNGHRNYVLKWITDCFKSLVGNPRHIDKKDISQSDLQAVYDYITKTLYSPEQQQPLDQWRVENSLEKVYLKGSLTC